MPRPALSARLARSERAPGAAGRRHLEIRTGEQAEEDRGDDQRPLLCPGHGRRPPRGRRRLSGLHELRGARDGHQPHDGSPDRQVGGKKLDNVDPSLSPDGAKVVFERDASDDSGRTLGIWTAKVDGSRLRQLAKVGEQPLWSPAGGKVAYVAAAGKTVALRLVSAGGGKSRALVPGRVQNVFGWSPDGRYIAFEMGSGTFGMLAVVGAATGKVRQLLAFKFAPTAVWSPDSSKLLVYSLAKSQKCWSLSRVPVDGSAPTLISSCNS